MADREIEDKNDQMKKHRNINDKKYLVEMTKKNTNSLLVQGVL